MKYNVNIFLALLRKCDTMADLSLESKRLFD